jgi:DNA-binding GntR family transcriptional regulator
MQSRDEDSGYVARAYAALRDLVMRYEYRPCHRLDIGEMALRLSISRTPVREAMNRLLNDMLIVQYKNRGFYTRPLDVDEILSLLEMREFMSVAAIRVACERGNDYALATLDRTSVPTCAPEASHTTVISSLIAMGGNPELRKVFDNIEARLHFFSMVYLANDGRQAVEDERRRTLVALAGRRDSHRASEFVSSVARQYADCARDVVKEGFARLYVDHDRDSAPVREDRLLHREATGARR